MIHTILSKLIVPNRSAVAIFATALLLGFYSFGNSSHKSGIKEDFGYKQLNNSVEFSNVLEGEYYLLKWDFANNETETSSDKKKTAKVNYQQVEDYALLLKVSDITTKNASTNKAVSISEEDSVSFENLTLVWSDEFDGNNLNHDNWTYQTGASGWGNNELQNYTNGDNAQIVDGKLIITARKKDNDTLPGSYTSTRIVTKGKQEFQYGRMEIRAKLPSGTGIWPAIWMLGTNISSIGWPACGEIDIMEYVGYQPNVVHSTVHTISGSGSSSNGSKMTITDCEEDFHVYGLYWTEEKLVFYIDNIHNVVHIYNPSKKNKNNWPFNQAAFFILNIAVGGNWGGAQGIDNSIFPQKMEVDYVRVYQENIR